MKIGMTMMVRDEADIIRTNLEYYIDQEIDVILITDNGSTDGTTDILREFERSGAIELSHDPVHRKQQSSTVTGMARRLSTEFEVDWVINADADEFLLPRDRDLTLRRAFERIPAAVASFMAPVVNMLGPMMRRGSSLDQFVWRDERSLEQLQRAGLHAHPTGNAIHVARDDVRVAQGNHAVSIANQGAVPAEAELEVLHFPWRSWEQYEHRVQIAGEAYSANPDIIPSPNHHGMADFRRLRAGVLLAYFAARVPSADELWKDPSFVLDDSLLALLKPSAAVPATVVPFEKDIYELSRAVGLELVTRDAAAKARITALEHDIDALAVRSQELESNLADARAEIALMRSRKSVRISDAVGRSVRRLHSRADPVE